MKTTLSILVGVLAMALIYFVFLKPAPSIEPMDNSVLWNGITDLVAKSDSLDKLVAYHDSLDALYPRDSMMMKEQHRFEMDSVKKLSIQELKDLAHTYVDSTLSDPEKELEIVELGLGLQHCLEDNTRTNLRITQLDAHVSDLQVQVDVEKDKNERHLKINKALAKRIGEIEKSHKKELRKTKVTLGTITLLALVIAGLSLF